MNSGGDIVLLSKLSATAAPVILTEGPSPKDNLKQSRSPPHLKPNRSVLDVPFESRSRLNAIDSSQRTSLSSS